MTDDADQADTSFFSPHIEEMSLEKDGARLQWMLMHCSYIGDDRAVLLILEKGVSAGTVEEATGMTALHYAVGRNNLDLTRMLVSHDAPFVPDKFGRWPTTIAGECEVSGELCDYIVEAEAAFLGLGEVQQSSQSAAISKL